MIKPHFVRKGCAGRVQIAILPQFLAIEPHFYQNAFEMQRFSKLQLSDCQRERPTGPGQRDNGNATTGQRERDNGTGSTEPILHIVGNMFNMSSKLKIKAPAVKVGLEPSRIKVSNAPTQWSPGRRRRCSVRRPNHASRLALNALRPNAGETGPRPTRSRGSGETDRWEVPGMPPISPFLIGKPSISMGHCPWLC